MDKIIDYEKFLFDWCNKRKDDTEYIDYVYNFDSVGYEHKTFHIEIPKNTKSYIMSIIYEYIGLYLQYLKFSTEIKAHDKNIDNLIFDMEKQNYRDKNNYDKIYDECVRITNKISELTSPYIFIISKISDGSIHMKLRKISDDNVKL